MHNWKNSGYCYNIILIIKCFIPAKQTWNWIQSRKNRCLSTTTFISRKEISSPQSEKTERKKSRRRGETDHLLSVYQISTLTQKTHNCTFIMALFFDETCAHLTSDKLRQNIDIPLPTSPLMTLLIYLQWQTPLSRQHHPSVSIKTNLTFLLK